MRYYNANSSNCLQCCIANILDLPLERVVDVSKVPNYWIDTLMLWGLEAGYRIRFTYDIPYIKNRDSLISIPYIAIVNWEVSGCHAVSCNGIVMTHNPNPSHKEAYTGSLYNIIITREEEHATIFKDNGEPISTFMDSIDVTKEG